MAKIVSNSQIQSTGYNNNASPKERGDLKQPPQIRTKEDAKAAVADVIKSEGQILVEARQDAPQQESQQEALAQKEKEVIETWLASSVNIRVATEKDFPEAMLVS